jgi:hypothetical protein
MGSADRFIVSCNSWDDFWTARASLQIPRKELLLNDSRSSTSKLRQNIEPSYNMFGYCAMYHQTFVDGTHHVASCARASRLRLGDDA